MNKALLWILVVGGVLDAVTSFTSGASATTAIELLWVANDLTLILGFIGLFCTQGDKLSSVGKAGLLLVISALAFIAGPSAQIANIPAYSIGAPLVALGLIIYAIVNWSLNVNARWISVALFISIVANIIASALNALLVTTTLNLILSLSIIMLALDTLNTAQRVALNNE